MINKLIDEAKEKSGIKSDSKLAERIGVTRGALNNWRNGLPIKHEHLAKLARLTAKKSECVIAEYEMKQENIPEIKSMWERIANHAAVAIIALPILSVMSDYIYYVKFNRNWI